MIYKKYCTRCKTVENLLPSPYSISFNRNGDRVGYYMCNDCNSRRHRRYQSTKHGAEKTRKAQKRQYIVNKKKVNARQLLNSYLKKGIVTRPLTCVNCFKECTPDAHHHDYDLPLEVIWLCRQCHALVHRIGKSISYKQ